MVLARPTLLPCVVVWLALAATVTAARSSRMLRLDENSVDFVEAAVPRVKLNDVIPNENAIESIMSKYSHGVGAFISEPRRRVSGPVEVTQHLETRTPVLIEPRAARLDHEPRRARSPRFREPDEDPSMMSTADRIRRLRQVFDKANHDDLMRSDRRYPTLLESQERASPAPRSSRPRRSRAHQPRPRPQARQAAPRQTAPVFRRQVPHLPAQKPMGPKMSASVPTPAAPMPRMSRRMDVPAAAAPVSAPAFVEEQLQSPPTVASAELQLSEKVDPQWPVDITPPAAFFLDPSVVI